MKGFRYKYFFLPGPDPGIYKGGCMTVEVDILPRGKIVEF